MIKEGKGIDGLIEKYRFWIGSLLLIAVLASGWYLYRRTSENNGFKKKNIAGLEEFSNMLDKQDDRINELERKISELSSGAPLPVAAPTNTESGEVAGVSESGNSNGSTQQGKINLNTASATQLDSLPGIGPAYASRIIEYRSSNGFFKDIAEVQNIKGIGPKTFEKIKELITI